MNRLLSRREKDGLSHRRQKSRDKSSHKSEKGQPDEQKVLHSEAPYFLPSLILVSKSVSHQSLFSLSAAFSNPQGKARPSIQLSTLSPTIITRTKSDLCLQIRPLSSTDNVVITLFKYDPQRKLEKEQEAKVGSVRELSRLVAHWLQIQLMKERLASLGYINVGDQQLQYGLFSRHAGGNVDKAMELVVLFQESVEGVIKPYNPAVDMKGAINNKGVTCWLDSLLFAMFARLPSFEPILCTIYDDEPRRRLSTLIRLWVNMLRSGMLINTDVVCGYKLLSPVLDDSPCSSSISRRRIIL